MTYTIEKGVPLPVTAGGRASTQHDYPFAEMQIGDSFLVPCDGDAKALNLLRQRVVHAAARRRNECQADFAVATRVEGKGVRVWRVEYREPTGRKRGRSKAVAPAAPAASVPDVASGARVHRLANAEDEHFDAGGRTRLAAKPAKVQKMSFDIPKFADGGKPSRVVKGSRY